MIGRPSIGSGDLAVGALFLLDALNVSVGQWTIDEFDPIVQVALDGRLALVPTGTRDPQVPLTLGGAEVGWKIDPGTETERPGGYRFAASFAALPQERLLYDVAARGDDDVWHIVAPHAYFRRQTWTDFGIAHISDMHVARRIDSFRGILAGLGRVAAAEQMLNWNDRFRGFIRYANHLYDTGVLDVVLATGDLYDYIYENDDVDESLGGNAAFLRRLVLGQEPGPDFPDVEELRVPIFMVPGNHDYRKHPYELIFDINVVKDWKRVKQYGSYNLSQEDAEALNQVLRGGSGTGVPDLGEEAGTRMIEVDEGITSYKHFLADVGSYLVPLGEHRIVMIDSGPDIGVVDDTIGALRTRFGMLSEDELTFVGGSPNCEGVDAKELEFAQEAMGPAGGTGLVLVGLHAPLFNPWKTEYPYFLRETQRPEQGTQVHGFLARHAPVFIHGEIVEDVEEQLPHWFAAENDHRTVRFVKRVDTQTLLDYGVSRGETEALLQLLAGVGGGRRADVVLAGHTHRHNEFMVRPGWDGALEFAMDFYTENPYATYPTTYTTGWKDHAVLGRAPVTSTTYVEVRPGADPDQTPWPMPFEAMHDRHVQVPPYPTPLATAADPRAWWDEHRLLVLQTGALGPMENFQVSFSGFRLLRVKGDVIDKIHFIPIERLARNSYRMALEDAVRVDAPGPYAYVERSRPLGPPAAAGAVAGVSFPALGITNVTYRDDDGQLHQLWRTATDRGTGNLSAVAPPSAVRAASDPAPFLAPADGLLVALYRGVDSHIHSLFWSTGAVGHDALSGLVGAPQAVGKPVGYASPDGSVHVIYRTKEDHLIELRWSGQAPPEHRDLTALAGAPVAAGDPSAYVNTTTGENVVTYRGADDHVHVLYWTAGDVGHDDLSGYTGSANAVGDPVGYYFDDWDRHQITYRTSDGHLHELWWVGNAPVSARDMTSGTPGAPPAANDPAAYASSFCGTQHLVYRSADGHVHVITWTRRGAPNWIDLTREAIAPLAADRPSAFTVEGTGDQHVVYRGVDGEVHEIRWSLPPKVVRTVPDTGHVFEPADGPAILAGTFAPVT